MTHSIQSSPQPYPLYVALVDLYRHDEGEPLEYTVGVCLVLGWNYYSADGGGMAAAQPIVADRHGQPPHECAHTVDGYLFSPDRLEAERMGHEWGEQRGATFSAPTSAPRKDSRSDR